MNKLQEIPVLLANGGKLSHISPMFRANSPPGEEKGLESYE
jgi:hypothetical protein